MMSELKRYKLSLEIVQDDGGQDVPQAIFTPYSEACRENIKHFKWAKVSDIENTRPNDAKAMIAEGMKAIDKGLLYRAVSDKIAEEHGTKWVSDATVLDALLAVCEPNNL